MSSPSSPSGDTTARVIDLVKEIIDRDYPDWQKNSVEHSQLSSEATGWTIDLSHHDLRILPEGVVDILGENVRRLAIGHNRLVSIPARLADCQNLRYFNARNNDIHTFPEALLSMPNLEIIDLSDNKMAGIPDAIEKMPALNALAIASNKIERLPACLFRMKKLRMIKVHGNPLQYPPADILEIDPKTYDPKIPNAYEMAVTANVKQWLYDKNKEKTARMRAELSPAKGRPAALDIAKATRRTHGTRFPVKPSLSSISIEPHSSEAEEKTSAASIDRSAHETLLYDRFGLVPSGRISFETPGSSLFSADAPPIPPRSESRLNSHPASLSIENSTTFTLPERPRLKPLSSPDHIVTFDAWQPPQRALALPTALNTDRVHRQAQVWQHSKTYQSNRHLRSLWFSYKMDNDSFSLELEPGKTVYGNVNADFAALIIRDYGTHHYSLLMNALGETVFFLATIAKFIKEAYGACLKWFPPNIISSLVQNAYEEIVGLLNKTEEGLLLFYTYEKPLLSWFDDRWFHLNRPEGRQVRIQLLPKHFDEAFESLVALSETAFAACGKLTKEIESAASYLSTHGSRDLNNPIDPITAHYQMSKPGIKALERAEFILMAHLEQFKEGHVDESTRLRHKFSMARSPADDPVYFPSNESKFAPIYNLLYQVVRDVEGELAKYGVVKDESTVMDVYTREYDIGADTPDMRKAAWRLAFDIRAFLDKVEAQNGEQVLKNFRPAVEGENRALELMGELGFTGF
ncbi:MAG: RAM signaling network component [Bogoriella megaspora]|nr:MAG: RAM signaling network component [Bogoriella megaspora]